MEDLENILPDIATMEILSESFQSLSFLLFSFFYFLPLFIFFKAKLMVVFASLRSAHCLVDTLGTPLGTHSFIHFPQFSP